MEIYLDFETRSRVDLRKCGQSVYARDASTEALCLAYAIDDGDVRLWVRGEPMPEDLRAAAEDAACGLHAHNASFEIAIWTHVCVARLGWPAVPLDRWHCTAARCAAAGLPRSLDQVASALGLAAQKDEAGRRVMMQLCKPRRPSKNNPDEWHTEEAYPDKYQTLYDYCKQDVVVEREIHAATPELSAAERRVWLLDQTINERGIPIDLAGVANAKRTITAYNRGLERELKQVTGGEVTTGKQQQKMLAWLHRHGVNVADLTADSVLRALEQEQLPAARRVLEIRKELGLSSIAKYDAMANMADADGRVRGAHLYHGAATGRWAGKGVQFQNVPRGSLSVAEVEDLLALLAGGVDDLDLIDCLFGSVPQAVIGCIRGMVCAEPGNRLLVCDFSGIEARVLAWLAGERWLLDAFAAGRDIYKEMAGDIYGVRAEDVTKGQRQVGKIAILGLGYGMGAAKFQATCEKFRVAMDAEMAQRVVDIYREKNSRIKAFWWALADGAVAATEHNTTQRVRAIRYGRWRDYLLCGLPSGRRLFYFDPKIELEDRGWGKKPGLTYMSLNSFTRKWERTRTYGGKLCENVVQAVARCFLVEAMHRLESAGYPIIFHVHDEAVCEAPDGVGGIAEVERIMCELPEWGSGCPIGAEGFEARRYRK